MRKSQRSNFEKNLLCCIVLCLTLLKNIEVPTLRTNMVENGEKLLTIICRLNVKKGLEADFFSAGMLKSTIKGYAYVR